MHKVSRKSIYLLTATTSLFLGGTATAAGLYKQVTLVVDHKKEVVTDFRIETVQDLLREKGIPIGEQDLVQPGRNTLLFNGMEIQVRHMKKVAVQDGDQGKRDVVTYAATVGELLQEQRITLRDTDQLNLPPQTPLASGQTIVITRREERVTVSEEKIPFQTERQPEDSLYTGQERELTPGVEGLARVTIKVIVENGQEVDRQVSRAVVNQPVNRVVAYGTKSRPLAVSSRSGDSFAASRWLTMTATAYAAPGGYTATGIPAQKGVVAVDPQVIPLGTKLYIPGYGYAIAADVGGAIKGHVIDLAFNSQAEALNFGRRTVNVYIVD